MRMGWEEIIAWKLAWNAREGGIVKGTNNRITVLLG